tara:strand:- start:3199 stop:4203 length:1005 start_codon:yes stop_codon:yes gene_type:complete
MKSNRTSSLMNPMTFSVVALGLILLFLIFMTPNLYRSGQTIFLGSPEPDDSLDKLLARHEQNMQTDVDRFNGRSFFYTPPIVRKPPPPPPPPPPRPVEEEKPPPPPPEPSFPPNYTGPKLVAILGAEAWFKQQTPDGDPLTRLNIGDSHDDIDVLATDPPRGITVKYRGGGPYDVSLINMELTPFSDRVVELEMPRGILEDVPADEEVVEDLPEAEQCERAWRMSIARLGFTNEYEPVVAIDKRVEIYEGWIRWWGRTPDTMRSLGAPSVELLEAMIDELRVERIRLGEAESAESAISTPGEPDPDETESPISPDEEPKNGDSTPEGTDKEDGS